MRSYTLTITVKNVITYVNCLITRLIIFGRYSGDLVISYFTYCYNYYYCCQGEGDILLTYYMKLNRWWTDLIYGCPGKGLIQTIVCLRHVAYKETAIGYHRQSGILERGANLYSVLVPSNATNWYTAVYCNICTYIGIDYCGKSRLERCKGWNVK